MHRTRLLVSPSRVKSDLIFWLFPPKVCLALYVFRHQKHLQENEHPPIQHLPASYERGMEMPIFLGATSKVILAHLPDRILKKTYLNHESTI